MNQPKVFAVDSRGFFALLECCAGSVRQYLYLEGASEAQRWVLKSWVLVRLDEPTAGKTGRYSFSNKLAGTARWVASLYDRPRE